MSHNANNIEEGNLKKRVVELESQLHELERDLIHDALTGLKTRTFFEEELGIYLDLVNSDENDNRKKRFGFKNLSIIFFDIDHFKQINDTYGHDIGDIALCKVARVIQDSLRTGDTPTRWGGEEIVASLLGANEEDAYHKAEEIRKKIENLIIQKAPNLRMTISSGVALAEKNTSVSDLIKRADKALYVSKNSGRNKVTAFSKIPDGDK